MNENVQYSKKTLNIYFGIKNNKTKYKKIQS